MCKKDFSPSLALSLSLFLSVSLSLCAPNKAMLSLQFGWPEACVLYICISIIYITKPALTSAWALLWVQGAHRHPAVLLFHVGIRFDILGFVLFGSSVHLMIVSLANNSLPAERASRHLLFCYAAPAASVHLKTLVGRI